MGKITIKTKEFKLPIYPSNVIFVYSNSYDAILKFAKTERFHQESLKVLEAKDYSGYTFLLKDTEEQSYNYIIVKKHKNKYEDIDTITHEIAHAVNDILTCCGVKYSKSNDEAFAYLTGYLNKEFFKFKDGRE